MNIHTELDKLVCRLAARQQNGLNSPVDHSHLVPAYFEREIDEIFPAPPREPNVRKKRERRLGPYKYTSYVFDSAHEPLPEGYRDYYRRKQVALHRFPVGRVSRRHTRRAVIYLHGWNESHPIVDDTVIGPIMNNEFDADFFHFRKPYHGPRKPDNPSPLGLSFFTADVVKMFEALRQSVIDARTLLQWLLNSGRYDEIGVVGISLGGIVCSLAVCAEHRFDFAVPMIGNLHISRLIVESPVLHKVRSDLDAMGLSAEFARDSLRRGGIDDFTPRIPHQNVVIVAAEQDQLISAESMRDVIDRWRGVREIWIPGGHITCLPGLIRALPTIRNHIDDITGNKGKTPTEYTLPGRVRGEA